MKKILFLLLIPVFIFSSNLSFEVKIYDIIFSSIFPHKNTIKVWTDSIQKANIIKNISKIKIVHNIKDADLLLINKDKNIKTNKVKFVTNYRMLKKYRASSIGGFYWKKGRPNILFLKNNLKQFNIILPKSMNKYIEESI